MKRILIVALLMAGFLCSCSPRTQMPKHRKRRHCNCPTFSLSTPSPTPDTTTCAYA